MHGFSRALSWKFVKIPCWRISEAWERWMKALLCLYNSRSLGELIYIICPIVSILLYSHLVFTLLRLRTRSSSRDWSIDGTDYASGQDYYFHFRFHALHACLLCSIRLQIWRTTWDLYRNLSTLYTTGNTYILMILFSSFNNNGCLLLKDVCNALGLLCSSNLRNAIRCRFFFFFF